MTSALNIALSGLNAASLQAQVSAGNLANAKTTQVIEKGGKIADGPYVPKDVVQVNQSLGGTLATVADSNKPTVKLYEPDHPSADENGVVEYPDIDIADELVKMENARSAYMSSLKSIEAQQGIYDSLNDIFA